MTCLCAYLYSVFSFDRFTAQSKFSANVNIAYVVAMASLCPSANPSVCLSILLSLCHTRDLRLNKARILPQNRAYIRRDTRTTRVIKCCVLTPEIKALFCNQSLQFAVVSGVLDTPLTLEW